MKYLLFALLGLSVALQAQAPAAGSSTKATLPHVFVTSSPNPLKKSIGAISFGVVVINNPAARPQSAEVLGEFSKKCSGVALDNSITAADYVVSLEHQTGKGPLARYDKVAVYARLSGEKIAAKDTLSIDESIKNACNAIAHHWPTYTPPAPKALPVIPATPAAAPVAAPTTAPAPAQQVAPAATAQSSFSITVDSTPGAADIVLDGDFVGSTPSTIPVSLGVHEITLKKKGYTDWTRKLKVVGGSVRLNAELEKSQSPQ
jgi:hypothetical protein